MKRRILFIQFTNPAAYPPLLHAAEILAARGWQLSLLGTDPGGSGSLQFPSHAGVAVSTLDYVAPGWRQKIQYFWYALVVAAKAVHFRPSWIYASDPLSCWPALIASWLCRARLVYHEHDSPSPQPSSNPQRVILKARAIMAKLAACCILPNRLRVARFEREFPTALARIRCVWNCPSRREVCEIGAHLATLNDESFWLCYQGSINRERLPPQVVESLGLLPHCVGLRVIGYETIGSKGYCEELKRHAESVGIDGKRIEFVGLLPQRRDMLNITAASHVGLSFVQPVSGDINMTHMVGASNKAFEYLACAIPLLVSRTAEWEEAFVRPGYGLACDPTDARDIAGAVRQLIENPAERIRMGVAGRNRVLTEWNYEAQFSPIVELLETTGD